MPCVYKSLTSLQVLGNPQTPPFSLTHFGNSQDLPLPSKPSLSVRDHSNVNCATRCCSLPPQEICFGPVFSADNFYQTVSNGKVSITGQVRSLARRCCNKFTRQPLSNRSTSNQHRIAGCEVAMQNPHADEASAHLFKFHSSPPFPSVN